MSTFIQCRPIEVEHDPDNPRATKQTTFCRLDNDDFYGTIRLESTANDGTKSKTDYQFNFSGLQSGTTISGNQLKGSFAEVIDSVSVVKDGSDERVNVAVKAFYPVNQVQVVPNAGYYWYNPKTHYDPQELPSRAKGETTENKRKAPDPTFPNTAQFHGVTTGITIWNEADLSLGTLPTAATAGRATSYTTQRLFTELSTDSNRQQHLKSNLREIAFHPEFNLWLQESVAAAATSNETAIDVVQKSQQFLFWLEMMARAISIESNMNTEAKFNLLNGDSSLKGFDLIAKISGLLAQLGTNRSSWRYHRLGSVAGSSPYTYTAPTAATWSVTSAASITLSNPTIGDSWLQWLGS